MTSHEEAAAFLRKFDAERKSALADSTPSAPAHAFTLSNVVETFQKWLYLPDPSPLKVVLGAVAANLMPGDPLWLLLVGATGSGKTELLDPLMGLSRMHAVGTLSEAALLSGSPKREKGADSTGGLLRILGDFGFLVLKDFTTVLSMSGRDSRAVAGRAARDPGWPLDPQCRRGRRPHAYLERQVRLDRRLYAYHRSAPCSHVHDGGAFLILPNASDGRGAAGRPRHAA